MENVYLLIDGVIGLSLLILAIVSLLKQGYKSSVNRLFAMLSILTAIWILSSYMGGNVDLPKHIVLVSNYIAFAAGLGVAILLMQFIVRLSGVSKLELILKRSLLPLWIICLICFTPLIVADVLMQDNTYAVISGPLMFLYLISLLFIANIITFGIIHGLSYNRGLKRRQLETVGIGLLISIPAVILLDFIIPMSTGVFSIAEFGITPVIILVISLYYSVIKFSLFDIKLAALRFFTYLLSLLTLSVAYFSLAYILSIFLFNGNLSSSVSISPINIFLALVLAFIFQPIKRFFDKATNRLFYKANYNTDDFFVRISKKLTSTTDLRGLLERAANEIGGTLKSDQAFFFIYTHNGRHVTAGTHKHKQLPKYDASQLATVKNKEKGVIIASFREEGDPIRNLMLSHRIELALPLEYEDKLIGFLCLGDHLISKYTERDMKVLGAISDELIIAIRNALAVQEIREFNVTLQQQIANATKELRASNAVLRQLDKAKDEFVGMASHQLRTPLTSVKGYISMVLEGDAGEVTDSQKQLLNEAFTSSERMVRLINDFLNVSRLQTGKFIIDKHPADLSKVVAQEIDSLHANALAHNTKFVYDMPKKFPIIEVDEGKMRQVIMNFADNAVYYSNDNSIIEINLSVDKNNVIFTVKDTGIGVPIDEQPELFSKFYRASNARQQRPDGTGVGLYLAKKIITAHGGKIIFNSVENKGSTFGFSLPIK